MSHGERARQAAIAVGLVESEYFPMLTLAAFGGYQTLPLPAPQNLIPQGFFRVDTAHLVPGLGLKWLLLDFARVSERPISSPRKRSSPPSRWDTGTLCSMLTSRWAGIVHVLDIEPTDPVIELPRQARESSG